ncbi:hypothetical protein Nmel_000421, partial [Mimus melanotis]
YDRQKLTIKEIHNFQYVAYMNPDAGSFITKPKFQLKLEVSYYSNPIFNTLNNYYLAFHYNREKKASFQKMKILLSSSYELLTGIGGKQSLSGLAGYICSLELFQITQKKLGPQGEVPHLSSDEELKVIVAGVGKEV